MADDDETDDEPSEAELRKFNKMFHKASGERDKRLERSLMSKFDTMLGGKFDELRTTLMDTSDDDTSDDDTNDDAVVTTPPVSSTRSGLSPEDRAELRRSQNAAKEAKATAEKYKKDFEDERAQRTRAEERQTLVATLGPYVKPKILDIVVDQVHSKHLVRDAETGHMLWKGEDGETLPLKDGALAWSKSDIGKEFAPPVTANGRGGRGPDGGNGMVAPGKMTLEHLGDIVTGSIPGQKH